MGISEYHGSKNDPINARLGRPAGIQHFELGPYFSEKRINRFGVRTYDFERTIGCDVHEHLFREDSKHPWMTQLTFIRRLFFKQGCLRFLDHTVLCRSFFCESGGIIALSLIWWDYSVIFHQSLLDMEASTFPKCIHPKSTYLWSKCMAQSPKYMAYI